MAENATEPVGIAFERRGCCHWPSFGSCWWERVSEKSPEKSETNRLWARGKNAIKRVKEWSEVVAGPRWKTFIRKFGRNRSYTRIGRKFQYDPVEYSLNFDEGERRNNSFPGFSSRYPKLPAESTKGSRDQDSEYNIPMLR